MTVDDFGDDLVLDIIALMTVVNALHNDLKIFFMLIEHPFYHETNKGHDDREHSRKYGVDNLRCHEIMLERERLLIVR